MRHLVLLGALASASAIGIVATPAERQRGRLMRAPDHFPAWHYGPHGQAQIFNSEEEIPAGWQDHPSKVPGAASPNAGQGTAHQSANGSISEAGAAKTTTAKSQTATDPAKAARNTGGGTNPAAGPAKAATTDPNAGVAGDQGVKDTLDAHGHPYDPTLHAGTGSKTKAGLWRMKVGVARPDAKAGYPLDL